MFSNRYNIVLYQIRVAIDHSNLHMSDKLDIRRLSVMTGFSEETIIEALEFGGPHNKHDRHI